MADTPKPVLKWAGGKRQLINTIDENLPLELKEGQITKYFEPMVGGAAVFFHIKKKYPSVSEYYISDYNWDLFILYKIIQTRLSDLLLEIKVLQDEYLPLPPTQKGDKEGERISMYLRIRKEYNQDVWDNHRYKSDNSSLSKKISDECIRRAAITVFLNRTCFNGLYRVNKSGKFNVPHGRYDAPKILDTVNLKLVNQALQGVEISVGSYEEHLGEVDGKSFVYFDPPYRPLPGTASFNDYHKASFGDSEQRRLADKCKELHNRGAKIMLSNSNPKFTDPADNFFDELFSEDYFCINEVTASRVINSDGEKRGKITEILVTNYGV